MPVHRFRQVIATPRLVARRRFQSAPIEPITEPARGWLDSGASL
jgi:hypothetical protein